MMLACGEQSWNVGSTPAPFLPYIQTARGRPASRRIPSPPGCLPRVTSRRPAVIRMSGEDQFDRLMSEVIGPGIDRDWLADARSISAALHSAYHLPLLDDNGLAMLANGLDGIELCSRPHLQTVPLSKTDEQNKLREVHRLADELRSLLDPDTPFGKRFLAASERAALRDEGVQRRRPQRAAPFLNTVSPIFGMGSALSFAARVAEDEYKRLKKTAQRRRSVGHKTEVLGRDLPGLYDEVYPGAPIGSYNHYREQHLDGPRHRFVQMCAGFLGFPDVDMTSIEKMARDMARRAVDESDE